mmetsp:Transcript_62060/g.148009  ORF Transcript_62060/g.148009 Transcript_62060/m.148009 type:complete len:359 (+) Transcript_62060:113-1189(+)|eukprot:CAMPEP_0178403894 /NCGR_PEP_ID=MMETSP0689_2-20121128/17603_1 /TAXON_ID=160604 /ORGANISM="Amphidinium massartii, Strain CS-259" /LENGTH=358 /DNA_ID=CAMNT_0020024861 /DNA_START=227 /DNA_END=1303 /DNA_ORIENTATION=+
MFIVAALCLGSLAASVSGLRPKDAYGAEAADLATGSVQHVNASALIMEVEEGKATTGKLAYDWTLCKQAAAALAGNNWAQQEEWAAIKEKIQTLSNQGGSDGKWKQIGQQLGSLEEGATLLARALAQIQLAQDNTEGHKLQSDNAKFILYGPLGTLTGKITVPAYFIVKLAQPAIDTAYSKRKYAHFFKAFWFAKNSGTVPDSVTVEYDTERDPSRMDGGVRTITPVTLIQEVLAPLVELKKDLATKPDTVDAEREIKDFLERCIADDDELKVDFVWEWDDKEHVVKEFDQIPDEDDEFGLEDQKSAILARLPKTELEAQLNVIHNMVFKAKRWNDLNPPSAPTGGRAGWTATTITIR